MKRLAVIGAAAVLAGCAQRSAVDGSLVAKAEALGLPPTARAIPDSENTAAMLAELAEDGFLDSYPRQELPEVYRTAEQRGQSPELDRLQPVLKRLAEAVDRPGYSPKGSVDAVITRLPYAPAAQAAVDAHQGRQESAQKNLAVLFKLGQKLGASGDGTGRLLVDRTALRAVLFVGGKARSTADLDALIKLMEGFVPDDPPNQAIRADMRSTLDWLESEAKVNREAAEAANHFLNLVVQVLERKDEDPESLRTWAASLPEEDRAWVEDWAQMGDRQLEALAYWNSALAALKVMRHRRAAGEYPANLEAADAALTDPFRAKPLHYRRTANGFAVWSVGANRRNDRGARGDAGWQIPLPALPSMS